MIASELGEFDPRSPFLVIAGGGIAGLYAAYELSRRPGTARIVVLEASPDQWGGRIETEMLDGFIAEFGPMRFEPELQPLFSKLVRELELELVDFTGPSAGKIDSPTYKLPSRERHPDREKTPLNALELLRRGILLVMGRTLAPDDPAGQRHQAWLDEQSEEAYGSMRSNATLHGKPLWKMGFWNALTHQGILSHQALMKIRDTGTFYHMIPDNLNAIEWVIWWMRALKTAGADMKGIKGGSNRMVTELVRILQRHPRVTLVSGAALTSFGQRPDGIVECQATRGDRPFRISAQHLVLAMPQAPLKRLAGSLPPSIRTDLDAVNGFPMLKVFFATKKPWWDVRDPPPAQTRAHRTPTREVHYFSRVEDGHGMVLIYTDRPATEYWKHYVLDKDKHDRAEIFRGDQNPDLKEQAAWVLAGEAMEAMEADGPSLLTLTEAAQSALRGLDQAGCARWILDHVTAYAIRDWAREPYGAANHSWKPGVKSWEIQGRFAAFGQRDNRPKRIHICGEAYSDYSGFIEGALRTVKGALPSIVGALAAEEEAPHRD